MAQLKQSPPWIVRYREIEAFFARDPEVRVIYDEEENFVKLYVSEVNKAEALTRLIPEKYEFGNVALRVAVIPPNEEGDGTKPTRSNLYKLALNNNPALSYIHTVTGIITPVPFTYVVFDCRVVQYWTDNLGDINGITSTLYQELAKKIFEGETNVFFCTDMLVGENVKKQLSLGTPLGEWP